MTTKQIIKKIVFVVLTSTACSGLVVLLVAAIGRRNHELCKDYVITINGAQKNLFINEKDINKLLNSGLKGKIKNEPITSFNLRKLEQLLKGNAWVKNANLYFDNRDMLHVSVEEKEPIARIFTTTGKSYYIDSEGGKMPLSDMLSARVPVFTNFPDKKGLSTKDSILLDDVKKTASFILNDPFWMAQAEQIDITEDRTFEMIPTVGNHIVKLGNGDDIEKKFRRLFIFYQQVMSKTSFNKYTTVDVQYAGQVIGSKTKMSRIDSMQLKKNIEKLLQEARKIQNDTVAINPIVEKESILPVPKATIHTQPDPNPLKTTTLAKPKTIIDKTEEQKPKAVMPSRSN